MTTKRGRPRRLRAAASSERFPSLTPQALHADGGQLTRQSKQLLRAQSELADARNRYAALYEVDRNNRVGLSLWWWRAGADRSNALQAWWHAEWR